jgi:hypothetical protein
VGDRGLVHADVIVITEI